MKIAKLLSMNNKNNKTNVQDNKNQNIKFRIIFLLGYNIALYL